MCMRRRLHYADWLKNVSDIAAYPTTSFRLGCLFTLIQWKTQTCIRKQVVGCKNGELNTVAFQIERFPRFSSCKQQNRFQNTGYGGRRVTCHVTTLAAKWIPILLLYYCSSLASWWSSSVLSLVFLVVPPPRERPRLLLAIGITCPDNHAYTSKCNRFDLTAWRFSRVNRKRISTIWNVFQPIGVV